nr:MAG TPA: hypothetical protein [Caudoviricetes sp.]
MLDKSMTTILSKGSLVLIFFESVVNKMAKFGV